MKNKIQKIPFSMAYSLICVSQEKVDHIYGIMEFFCVSMVIKLDSNDIKQMESEKS